MKTLNETKAMLGIKYYEPMPKRKRQQKSKNQRQNRGRVRTSIAKSDRGSILGYQAFAGLVLALGVFAMSHGAFALAISFFAGWR